MSGYGSVYGGYYGARGPPRQNEVWMRPSWTGKYNAFGGYGGYGEQDYSYAQAPGVSSSYNGGYGSYGGSYGGYGVPGYSTAAPLGYGTTLPVYSNGLPGYAAAAAAAPAPPNYNWYGSTGSLPANSTALPTQIQQPGASAGQSVSSLYPNNYSATNPSLPSTAGITNPTGGWPPGATTYSQYPGVGQRVGSQGPWSPAP